jgi:aldehyde:ferredoxin oxidoreductase
MTKKGTVVDRREFARMMAEYYQLRGWDKSGLQTKKKLAELGLEDIAKGLAQRGMVSH